MFTPGIGRPWVRGLNESILFCLLLVGGKGGLILFTYRIREVGGGIFARRIGFRATYDVKGDWAGAA